MKSFCCHCVKLQQQTYHEVSSQSILLFKQLQLQHCSSHPFRHFLRRCIFPHSTQTIPPQYRHDHPALSTAGLTPSKIILIMLKCVRRPRMSFHLRPLVSFNLSPAALRAAVCCRVRWGKSVGHVSHLKIVVVTLLWVWPGLRWMYIFGIHFLCFLTDSPPLCVIGGRSGMSCTALLCM